MRSAGSAGGLPGSNCDLARTRQFRSAKLNPGILVASSNQSSAFRSNDNRPFRAKPLTSQAEIGERNKPRTLAAKRIASLAAALRGSPLTSHIRAQVSRSSWPLLLIQLPLYFPFLPNGRGQIRTGADQHRAPKGAEWVRHSCEAGRRLLPGECQNTIFKVDIFGPPPCPDPHERAWECPLGLLDHHSRWRCALRGSGRRISRSTSSKVSRTEPGLARLRNSPIGR